MTTRPSREVVLCLLGSLALAVVQWWPLLRDPAATGFGDWQMIIHNWEAAYVSLTRFGEWPLWDPFHCGGVTIFGNPESQLYAPWFWLSFPLGTVLAVKVMLLGHVVAALLGMYWLCRRRYELQPPSAALAAVAWACGGWLVWDGAGGHATFLPFTFAPFLSYLVHCGRDRTRSAALAAGLLVLTLFEGGTYPLPFFVLWLALELSVSAAGSGSWRDSLRFAAISFGLLGLCGAIRIVPIYESLSAFPRQTSNDDALTPVEVLKLLVIRSHDWKVPGHPFLWPEYGSYLGWPVVLLAAAGLPLALRSGRRQVLLGLGVFGALMLGNFSDYAPYSLLHRLPVYDSLRVPSRFAVFVTLFVAIAAALACNAAVAAVARRRPRLAALSGWLIVLGVALDLGSASSPIVNLWREPPLSQAQPAATLHFEQRDYYRSYASNPRLNLGTPVCYVGAMNWPVSGALWLGASPQLRIVPARAGRIANLQQTPHTVHAALTLSQPARVVLNQNFARGYSSNLGPVLDDRGRVALDLPAGTHQLVLRYSPPELSPCALVSALGLALLAFLLTRRRTPAPAARNAAA